MPIQADPDMDFDSENVKTSPHADLNSHPPETADPEPSAAEPAASQPVVGNAQQPSASQPPDGPIEFWVETKTDAGKSYFYHSVTRETTWTRPEGRNVKVQTQAEHEAMNAAKQTAPLVAQSAGIDGVPLRRVESRPPPVLFGAPPPRFAMPPPMGMPPPGFGAPTWMIPPAAAQGPPPTNVLIDPVLVAKASEWTEHKAPDGRT